MSADAKTQSEHNFVWKPAFVTNVPLQLSGNKAVEGMFRSLMSSYGSGSMLTSKPFLRSQMMSVLPIICRAYADDWEQLFSNCTERNAEVLDIARCIRDVNSSNLLVVSLHLSEEYVSECTQILSKIGKHYEARVSILMPNGETLYYYGLSFDFDDDSREWHVSWIMSKARITELGSNPQFVLVSDLIFISPRVFSASEVSMAAIPHEQLQKWRIRMIPEEIRSASIFSNGLIEDNCSYRINFAVPDAWMSQSSEENEQLRAKVLQATVSDSTSVVTIRKGPSLSYASSAHLPSPVCSNGVQLQVSRKRRIVTCVVQKARFGLSSIRPADYWLDDDDAWISRPVKKDYLLTISGMQMTNEEKFISRSRGDENIPVFISLKENFINFFQQRGYNKFSLAFRGAQDQPNVQAVIIHNGLRREHRHGTLVADLSICFLKHHFMEEVLPWLGKTFSRDAALLWSNAEEFDLFKRIITLFRMQGEEEEERTRRRSNANRSDRNWRFHIACASTSLGYWCPLF